MISIYFENKLSKKLNDYLYLNNVQYDIIENVENNKVTSVEIIINVAGVDENNIDIFVENNILNVNVKSENNENKNEKIFKYKSILRKNINFKYDVSEFNIDNISATLKNGLLKIILPKKNNNNLDKKIIKIIK